MNIAVLSGKGGTGKTTVSTNLALALKSNYIDCDVEEPTKSGLEDLMRVVLLCEHFGVFTMVCINKFDINEEISDEIQEFIKEKKLFLAGKIPYDDIVMKSINELKPIIHYTNSKAGSAIKEMWNNIKSLIY